MSGVEFDCKTLRIMGDANPEVLQAVAAGIVQISKRESGQGVDLGELSGRLASISPKQLRGLFEDGRGIPRVAPFPPGRLKRVEEFLAKAKMFTDRFESLVRETRVTRTVLVAIAGAGRVDKNIARKIVSMSFM
jgi:hypothetical protein